MNNAAKMIIAIVVVAAVAGGAVLLADGQKEKNTSTSTGNNTNTAENDQSAPAAITITYDGNGFSPSTITILSGDTVKFVNNSDSEIKPSSNPHPTHTDNPGLNIGDIEPGQSKTVTLTTKGAWGFHNHYSTDQRGQITVE